MPNENGSVELYRKHRPTKFSELRGQPDAVRVLTEMGKQGKIPHCLLLTGPSGCGKTTIARILKSKLGCSDHDFCELNIADVRGIDTVRGIRDRMGMAPMGGNCRVWLLDEVARGTVDFQNSFLKILEDTPQHVYFILATTEPQRLLATIKTRATEIKLKAVGPKDMKALLCEVAGKEQFKLTDEVRDKIVEIADGSPRKALVLLNQILTVEGEEHQLAAVAAGDGSAFGINIARALMNPRAKWGDVAKLLKECEDEPETVRRIVLGYCFSVLVGGGSLAGRAYDLIGIFEKAWYDGGKASMAACCYEAVTKG